MNKKLLSYKAMNILGVYLDDLNKRIHGRQIAKELGANQRTVLSTLNRLENNKVLNSETVGKNREFMLNKKNELSKILIIMSEQFKTAQFLDSNFKVYSIIRAVQDASDGIILIFGSYARNQQTEDSDIDILVIGKVNRSRIIEIKKRSPIKIQMLDLSKKEFLDGIKNKKPFMLEILSAHIIAQGSEEFTTMRWKYG